MSQENKQLKRSIIFNLLPQIAYKIKIDEESKSRIANISNYLIKNPDSNFILYSNHLSYSDPIFEVYMSTRLDSYQTRHLIAPASYSHTDPIKQRSKIFMTMIKEARHCGIEIVRVIQPYQINNPDFGYTQEQANETYTKWLRSLQELGRSKTPTGVLISPEGHRSESGALGEGESGVIACGKLLFPAIYIPLGIHYERVYNRNGINLGKRVNLVIGNTYTQENRNDSPTLDFLMRNLASTLPDNMRGRWKNII